MNPRRSSLDFLSIHNQGFYCRWVLHDTMIPMKWCYLGFILIFIIQLKLSVISMQDISKSSIFCSFNAPSDGFWSNAFRYYRKLVSSASKPRSWFGPNGQYIRELPCPSCRGIERCRADCSLCNGKGLLASPQCLGDCVIWEESIDGPWEKASSVSPLKVKEDDEVDNLDIQLNVRRKIKRVYHSPTPEVNMKISRSLKKAKGTPAARRQASEAMKKYFRDPENQRKRSIAMKGVKFYCSNCRREGHRRNYCPELPHDLRIDSPHAGYVVKRVIIEEHARSQN